MPTENEISTRWLLTVIQKSFGMSLLETKSKVRLVKQAEQYGVDYSTPSLNQINYMMTINRS
ncbi:MAG: hypothetical protein WBW34_04080 [Nitrososphaeraceae archaeon]